MKTKLWLGLGCAFVIASIALASGCVAPLAMLPAAGLNLASTAAIQGASQSQADPNKKAQEAERPKVAYAGYSKDFQPKKDMIVHGKLTELNTVLQQEEEKLREGCQTDVELRDKVGMLGYLERGSIALAMGSTDNCIKSLSSAEEIVEEREKESIAKENMVKVGSVAAELVGIGEQGRYFGNGYERVMMLNLKAMAYLIQGDLRSYNVARLAITWQDEEREKFERVLQESAEKQAQEDANQEGKDDGSADAVSSDKGQNGKPVSTKVAFLDAINNEFQKYDAKALDVPSAYVNPFGHYMAGVIQEFRAIKDPSLKSNALISYQKALDLNPNSVVIKEAIVELANQDQAPAEVETPKKGRAKAKKAKAPKTEGMLHVVAFDGFVPEKKVMTLGIKTTSSTINIKVPVYDFVPNAVTSIKVQTTKGTTLATLDNVADLEALSFRHQKDSVPLLYASIMSSGLRDAVMKGMMSGIFGRGGDAIADGLGQNFNPDTRAWMSLPSTIKAARIKPPVGLKELVLVSYDGKGKQLASKKIKLNGTHNNFVFVRNMGSFMYPYLGKPIEATN